MSGPYKSMIGPALQHLRNHIVSTEELITKDENTEEEEEILRKNAKSLHKLIKTLEEKNQQWLDFLKTLSLNQTKQDLEQEKYEAYIIEGKHFYAWIEKAREMIDSTEELINHEIYLETRANVPNNRNMVREETELHVQLPRLQLPEFFGDPHHWISFWQSFESTIDKRNFSNVDKMKFLLNCLKGEAKDAVSDLILSNENYQIAVSTLKDRFGDKKILVEALESQLFKMPMCDENALSLKRTVDKIEKIFRQLESIGEQTDNSVMSSLIKSKLTRNFLLEIAKEEKSSNDIWTTKTLRNTLVKMVNVREAVFQCSRHFRKETWSQNTDKPPNKRFGQNANQTRTFQVTRKTAGISCYFCDGTHWSNMCNKIKRREDRMKRLSDQKRCFRCLRQGHILKDCDSKRNCRICNGSHNDAICPKKYWENGTGLERNEHEDKRNINFTSKNSSNVAREKFKTRGNNKETEKSKTTFCQINNITTEHNDNVHETKGIDMSKTTVNSDGSTHAHTTLLGNCNPLLMVLKIRVFSPRITNSVTEVLALLDSGSEFSYITENLARKLKLPKICEGLLEIRAFKGSSLGKTRSGKYVLGVERVDGRKEIIDLLSVDKISDELRSVTLKEIYSEIGETEIRNLCSEKGEPDLLLGINDFWRFFVKKREITKNCYLIDTTIGSLICGEFQEKTLRETKTVSTHMVSNRMYSDEMPTQNEIKSWWDLQSIGIMDDPEEKDDDIAQKLFDKSIRQVDGRYRTRWLWKEENPNLPSNYGISYRCLESLLSRFQNEKGMETLQRIDKTIQDQLKNNVVEIAEQRKGELEHYLPHHPVFKGEKIREVYNASAKTRLGKSLNQHMYRGPLRLPDLAGLLLRFRLSKFPLLGDIEKAFLQIELEEEDREVTKFLWIKDINKPLTPENMTIYRFTRIAFGVICSPSILAMTINHHLKKYSGMEKMMKDIYVDNIFVGCECKEEVVDNYHKLKQIFGKGKMNLREFVTNSKEAFEQIPEEDRLPDKVPKILGIKWNLENDELLIKFPNDKDDKKYTRRKVLETMASLFDPLGLVSPCSVEAKLLFQKLWENPKSWDEALDEDHQIEWINIVKKWSNQVIKVPRRIISASEGEDNQLHVFVDASQNTYAASVYLRSKTNNK